MVYIDLNTARPAALYGLVFGFSQASLNSDPYQPSSTGGFFFNQFMLRYIHVIRRAREARHGY